MSHFFDKLSFFRRKPEIFAGGHGITTGEDRQWERAYRGRWAYDKIVRSTHGANCTGSCSWRIFVKNGLVTWEAQFTDYPRTRPDLPNHEPRGCQRGASYSWYLYSAQRMKYPLMRGRLMKIWREAKKKHKDPVVAWESIVTNPELAQQYKKQRGLGGFVRSSWEEVNEVIASANIYTAKTWGPDRIFGFSPIPAMSMVSYAAGSRYLSLIGGVCMSFYDWYCDLPPSSPQIWGEQTDVPESADWYNAGFIMAWGSNVPQTRTPDAHFFTEVRYKGTKTVAVTPDYSEVSKLCDIWLHPKQGTDAALAMAMGHVIFKEFHVGRTVPYFNKYLKQYTDMPFLVCLKKQGDTWVSDRTLRASDFADNLGEGNNTEWKTVLFDNKTGEYTVPVGTIGSRWGEQGKWNLQLLRNRDGAEIDPELSFVRQHDDVVPVSLPYFGNQEHWAWQNTGHGSVLKCNVPARKVQTRDGEMLVATIFDLQAASYGVDQGLGGDVAKSFDDDMPYTPAWQEKITGVPREHVISVARQFADNAEATNGRTMIIIGAAMNHWYHMDMNYRGVINMLMLCGCIGQSGGGWAHYVGQEKLRPQTGWTPLAFALDWHRPPRQMNSTSAWYAHTDQWRYEKLHIDEILSPVAPQKDKWLKRSMIDCNAISERMGWLPSAPQLEENPLKLSKEARARGVDPKDYVVSRLKDGSLRMSCEDPDNPKNFPRNLFVWRSNILGSSGKGHEYFLKHLLGTQHAVLGDDLGAEGRSQNSEVTWHDHAPEGKLDLFVTLDFRMSTTALYSDIVLPAATWYEKNDLNTSDMHPFIHPLSRAVDAAWESRADWDIYKGFAKAFSELCPGHLGEEEDIVTLPLQHDTAMELGQPIGVKEWRKGECELIPGKTAPAIVVVKRDYPNTHAKFTSIGPLLNTLGNGGKGISWNTDHEVEFLGKLNGVRTEGVAAGRPKIESDIDACEMILSLAPETNGHVAVKSWAAMEKATGLKHVHLAEGREHEAIRYRDVQSQPRKIITSPTWSGVESEDVSYNSGYINVHELIPWRTLTGRQHFYQDHDWLLAFGEGFCTYKPPINTKTIKPVFEKHSRGKPQVALNFITPHQKWGIHSTYTENLLMLTLSRGGPIIWISEIDARKIGVADNDWIEAYNVNGTIMARAVVSQRVPEGMSLMYHAQEKLTTTPVALASGFRGGIHNSVTRACTKPTHMVGGYAQLSYGFNYYGTVGSNRDEFIIVRKVDDKDIEWKLVPQNTNHDAGVAQ